MSTTTFILIAGSAIFAITTLAALWTGYLLMQERWVNENADLTDEEDLIRPLFKPAYPEQQDDRTGEALRVSEPGIVQ